MKQFMLVLICFIISFRSFAQVGINAASSQPHPSAMLDVVSASKGLLIPRMTTALRSAITSPAKGLMVMDTTLNSLWYFNGISWGELSSVNANLWNKTGNDIFNTNTGNVGIGTTTPGSTALLHVDGGVSQTNGLLVTGTFNSAATVPNLGAGTRMMFYPGKSAFRAGTIDASHWNDTEVGQYSTAFGQNTIASGRLSVAIGINTRASGDYSTAMGNNTIAGGNFSTAMGNYTRAASTLSTAMGEYTIAKGFATTTLGMYNDSLLTVSQGTSNSTTPLFIIGNGSSNANRSNAMVVQKNGNVMIGDTTPHNDAQLHVYLGVSTTKGLLATGEYNASATVPNLGAGTRMMFYPGKSAFRAGTIDGSHWNDTDVGQYSTAFGQNTIASGRLSVAMGINTRASGDYSTAMGNNTIAGGNFSTAMGNYTRASSTLSTAMGEYTIAKGFATTTLGMYNDSLLTVSQGTSNSTTPLFIIGNGSSNANRSNAMVVQKNGNVMIGDATPHNDAQLHIHLAASTTKGLLVTGTYNAASTVPDLGAGSRLMFYPGKVAFRAGYVNGTQWNNSSMGSFSAAMGYNTTASGDYSYAMGEYTTASGNYSTAIGSSTKAIGFASTAMGRETTVSGSYSTAMGFFTNAGGGVSTAMGFFTIAKGFASTVVGMYNDSLLTTNQTLTSPTTPLFIVGNGDNGSSRNNAMVVRKSGDVEVPGALKPGNLQIGGGTVISKQLAGEATAGTNPASGFKTYTLTFPTAFSVTPKIIATAKNDPGFNNVDDTFVVSVRSISATQVIFNIQRVDSNTGWSQSLRIEWVAWE